MPRKKKAKAREPSAHADLLQRIHDRYKVMVEADQENRRKAMEDLKFVNQPGAQWDANMKRERGDRPCYEFNKLRINGKRVINEIRANRPQGKVRAVEGGDKKTAELYEGLCRNIANMSDLDTITDNAAEYQVDAGMACWRVVRKYAADDVFDQDILIEGIKNPFNLWVDPGCKDPLKRDAEDWILEDRISKEAYERKYKGKEIVNFEGDADFDTHDDWADEHTVRVVEYWYKEPYEKDIWLVQWPQPDGTNKTKSVDSTSDEAPLVKQDILAGKATLLKTRTAKCQRIMMCVAGGAALLEAPAVQVGTVFPFVMVFGETKVIEGKTYWWGLHRFAKDGQQSYNISRTAIDETIAMAPKEFFWATPKQAEGHTAHWAEGHRKNYPFRLYNADPAAPGAPVKQGGANVPVALIEQAAIAAQDIRDVTGLHEASFGEESSEKSGVALARKQNQAQIVTYNFPDNMAKGVKRTWEILIDYIPHVYDAERELRVLGADGAEDYQKVNQLVFDPEQGRTIRVNDVTTGKYDVTITTGPSFSTMRQEAAEIYPQIFPPDSPMFPFVADLVAKSLDYPFADEMSKRLLLAAPPAVQQMVNEGKEIPPEAQAALAQAEQAMQMVQQQTQLVQQAAQEVEQSKAASEQAKANVEKVIAQLEVKRAQFDAEVTKRLSEIAIKEAALGQQAAQAEMGIQQKEMGLQQRESALKAESEKVGDNKTQGNDLKEFKAQIDEATAKFMDFAGATLEALRGEVTKPKRKMKGAKTRREGGNLFADIEFDDGTTDSFQASRQGEGLVAVPVAAPTQPQQ
jgi:hypothetical protein